MSAVRNAPLRIDAGSAAHRVLLALRPGSPVELAVLSARWPGNHVGSVLIHLNRARFVNLVGGTANQKSTSWRITAAGREACPPRRGTFTAYNDFSKPTLGDI